MKELWLQNQKWITGVVLLSVLFTNYMFVVWLKADMKQTVNISAELYTHSNLS